VYNSALMLILIRSSLVKPVEAEKEEVASEKEFLP
jgi:hypothetical protein